MERVKTILLLLFVGIVAIYIQGSVLMAILPDFLVPNFLLSLIVFLAFYENSPFGALLVFLLGLQFDLYAGQPLLVGPTAGAFVAVFGLLSSLSQRIFVESAFAIFLVAFASSILNTMVHCVLVYEFNNTAIRYFSMSLIAAFVTACITPVVFQFMKYFIPRRGTKNMLGRSRMASA